MTEGGRRVVLGVDAEVAESTETTRLAVGELVGVYCERSMITTAGLLSSGTRITPQWGNPHWDHYSTGYATGQAAFAGFCVTWVGPFAVNSR